MAPRLVPGIAVCLLLFPTALVRAQDQSFDSNGVKIHYRVEGQGEPVVLVHGFAVNGSFQWTVPGITSALAKDYRVITLDNRGHGKSDKPHDPRMYGKEMQEDVIRLLDHLKIEKAHLVGYSMGGFLTLKLVGAHPERWLSATTGGAGLSLDLNDRFRSELAESLEQGKGFGPLFAKLTPEGEPKPTQSQMETINKMLSSLNDTKALAAVIRSMNGLAVTEEDVKNNKVPLLALIGEKDPLKKGVDEMKDKTPNLEVVVIKGADHMNAFARPEFIQTLKDFLAKHSQKHSDKKAEPKPEKG